MTTPVQPTPPRNVITEMRAALQAAREAGATDEQMDFLLKAWTREVQNVNEREALGSEGPSYAQQALGGIASLAKDIPGAEALQAGGRMLSSRLSPYQPDESYREALETVQGAEAAAPVLARIPNRLIGGTVASLAMPGSLSAAKSSALYGGLLNALSADPDQTIGERALNTGLGAGVGLVAGKVGDVVSTGLRARVATPLGEARQGLKVARSDAANPLYALAETQGAGGATNTSAIHAALSRPEVQSILDDIATLDAFKGLYPDDPKVLQEVVRRLSEDQGEVINQLARANPTRTTSRRATQQQLKTIKDELVNAMSAGPNAPMPAQRAAMDAYAAGSRRLDALGRGQRAAAIETGAGSAPENLERFGRTTLLDYLERNPEVRPDAAAGVLGFGRRKLEQAGVTGLMNPMRGMARNFLLDGGDLLRAIEGAPTAATEVAPRTLLDLLRRTTTVGGTPNLGDY